MAKQTTPPPKKKAIKKVALKKTKSPSCDICFVIMPFGGWFDNYYSEIYYPAIEKLGLIPRRADDLFRPSNIVQDIWELTKKAKIIIADLTNKNPNVFYELGLSHALAKPAILITETIDDIPFDLRSLRIIEYDKNQPDWGLVLQRNLENAIKETLESPNQTVPTAFLETKKSEISSIQVTKQEKDLLELKQEIEIIKRQVTRPNPQPRSTSSPYEAVKRKAYNVLLSENSPSVARNAIIDEFGLSPTTADKIISVVMEERLKEIRKNL